MKKIILFYILLFQMNSLAAQESCDSTLMSCDSVFIDSIIFAELPTTGDHVIFQITTEHHFLYAPNFVVCSQNNIDFSNTDYGYFSIYGPEEITPLYPYTNMDIPNNIFEGYMVVENSANAMENCIISFNTIISNQSTSIYDNSLEDKIKISPNPASSHILIEIENNNKIKNALLIDVLGKQQKVEINSSLIDITTVSEGTYILQLELDDGEFYTQKIIIGH